MMILTICARSFWLLSGWGCLIWLFTANQKTTLRFQSGLCTNLDFSTDTADERVRRVTNGAASCLLLKLKPEADRGPGLLV